jgi:hypothetical protein
MDLIGLFHDQLGNFTPYQIGGVVLGVLLAALLAFLLALLSGATGRPMAKPLAIMAAVTALAVALVRASVPLSIALVAVVLLVRGAAANEGWKQQALRLCAIVIGVGCGSSGLRQQCGPDRARRFHSPGPRDALGPVGEVRCPPAR